MVLLISELLILLNKCFVWVASNSRADNVLSGGTGYLIHRRSIADSTLKIMFFVGEQDGVIVKFSHLAKIQVVVCKFCLAQFMTGDIVN